MLDSRLVQGLLIATCISLAFAIIMTAVEIQRHQAPPGVVNAAPSAPARPAAEPAPEPAAEEEAPEPSALNLAPQGTWGFFVVNVPKLLQSSMLKDRMGAATQNMPGDVQPQQIREVVAFLVPGDIQTNKMPAVAVITLAPGARLTVETELELEGEPLSVAGVDAYKVDAPAPAPAQIGPMMGPATPRTIYVAFIDDVTLGAAESEDDLATLIRAAGRRNGLSRELLQLGQAFADSTIRGAVLVPPQLEGRIVESDSTPPFLSGLRGTALGADITDQLALRSLVRFRQASQAQEAVTMAQSSMDEAKQQVQGSPQMAALIDKLQMSAAGSDAKFSINLTEQDFATLMGFAMMQAMGGMGGQMGPPPGSPQR